MRQSAHKMTYGYKIVDETANYFMIQSTCLRTLVKIYLEDIATHPDIIANLSPEQACYLGISLALGIQSGKVATAQFRSHIPFDQAHALIQIQYETREKTLCCFHTESQEKHFLDPRSIALNPVLLAQFNGSQGFYIGFLAGNLNGKKAPKPHKTFKPQLSLIK